eukprot:sb/3477398/
MRDGASTFYKVSKLKHIMICISRSNLKFRTQIPTADPTIGTSGKPVDRGPRTVTKITFAPYILLIEIKFLAILRLEPESIGKMRIFSIQRNQDQFFILSGTGDMSKNV